jgi:hypothetical protein
MAKRAASQKVGKPATKRKAKHKSAKPSVYTVFISHSSKEKWIAGQISKEI